MAAPYPGYLAALQADAARFAAAARAGLDAPVPSCADWKMADLTRHLGMVHRWVTEIVRTGAQERVSRRDLTPPPDADAELPDWYEDGATALVDVLTGIEPEQTAWNWADNQPAPAAWWRRRMAHETAVHRWDAQAAHGQVEPIEAELAADGVDEVLDVILPGAGRAPQLKGSGERVHLHRTDGEGEWLLRFGPDGLEVERGHAKGDVALRGPASDLLLFLWNRVPASAPALEVFGDASLLDRWKVDAAF